MPNYGDKLTEHAAERVQREEDFKKSHKAAPQWKAVPVPRNPKWAGKPLPFPIIGRCAVVLDDKAGYCGAPNGDNAFRFCDFHASLYINQTVRLR